VATWTISDLIGQLETDRWRLDNGFSHDIEASHQVLFDPSTSRQEKADALSDWIAQRQPCLFGKMEARQRRLAFCLLTESDLERSDQEIRAKIARERRDWKRLALAGESHGFLIAVISETLAVARPDGPGGALQRLATRLCELYLGDGMPDTILHDDVLLKLNVDGVSEFRKWKVGVNFFSAQGDGRWWRDHRFPGGMAFSMNSVGHMARCKVEGMMAKGAVLPELFAEFPRERLVNFALFTAMRTIGPPVEGASRGTWLAAHGTFEEDRAPPPYDERTRHFREMAAYSENRYMGLYHTDESIPTHFFRDDLWRREDLVVRDDLYFTYLHSKNDGDYLSMGLGDIIDAANQAASECDDSRRMA
jgi:hypothetical protein